MPQKSMHQQTMHHQMFMHRIVVMRSCSSKCGLLLNRMKTLISAWCAGVLTIVRVMIYSSATGATKPTTSDVQEWTRYQRMNGLVLAAGGARAKAMS